MRCLRFTLALAVLLVLSCSTTTGPDGLKVGLRTARTTFAPADTFKGTFTISNTRANPVRTEFRALPRYEIDVYDKNDSVVLSSPWAYLQMTNELRLGPRGSEFYDVEFVLRTGNGLEPLPVGNYRIRARLLGYSEPHDDLNIRVE